MIKTLLVAPRHQDMPLPMFDNEVDAVLNSGLNPVPVTGVVTAEKFLQSATFNTYHVLFIISHGTEAGILLSDGLLPTSMFVQAVRDRFDLIVLNSCSGLSVAQMVQNECAAGVICTIGAIEDRAAYFTGSQLARELGRGLGFYDAYKRARPGGNTTYLYLAGKMNTSNLRELVEKIVREQIEKEMSTVSAIITELREEIQQDRAERQQRREDTVSILRKLEQKGVPAGSGDPLLRMIVIISALISLIAVIANALQGFF